MMSSSSTSSINTTTSSSKRLSGLMSGLDTDTLVKQLTSGTQTKIDKAGQNKQLTVWKQEAYRETIKALSEFKNKYLSSKDSTSSILNAGYFNVSTIKNTSTAVSISGNDNAAKNMVITQISQLAKQARFTSKHQVSTQALTTGKIKESWTANAVGGASITINAGGKDYKIALDGDFVFDKGDNANKIVLALNNAVSKIDDLKGKITFSSDTVDNTTFTDPSAISISSSETFTIKEGSASLLSGLGLTKGTTAAASEGKFAVSGTISENDLFKNTISADSELKINLDNTEYTLELDSAVNLTADDAKNKQALAAALNTAIGKNSSLAGKITAKVDAGNLVLDTNGKSLSITGGTQNMQKGLSLTSKVGTYTVTMNSSTLVASYLSDTLAGSTLTVNLNGLSKTITFDESEKDDYATPEALIIYLQGKLTSAYGTDSANNLKVTVSLDTNGGLSFKTSDPSTSDPSTSNPTSIFTVSSSDAVGILGKNGALHMYAGDSNRINIKKSLEALTDMQIPSTWKDSSGNPPAIEDIPGSMSTKLVPGASDNYEIKINGKQFTFEKTDTLDDIMTKINNDADANVNVFYSSVTDAFTVTAKNGGAASHVDIEDVSGNLGAALFGVSGTDYTEQAGQDAKLTMSFNGDSSAAQEITRSDNSFEIDGVTLDLLTTYNTDTNSEQAPISFTVENKTDDLVAKIKSFVEDYNGLISSLYTQISESKPENETYLPLTDDQKKEMTQEQINSWNVKAKQGLMHGDMTLNSLDVDLRQAMTNMVSSVNGALFQVGITTKEYGKDGKLVIDEDKLTKVILENPDKVTSLFVGEDGIANRLNEVIDKNIKTFGGNGILIAKAGQVDSVTTDTSTLTQLINRYDDQIEKLKDTLEIRQNQYYSKFTRLETYINQMNAQSGVFSSYFSSGQE